MRIACKSQSVETASVIVYVPGNTGINIEFPAVVLTRSSSI